MRLKSQLEKYGLLSTGGAAGTIEYQTSGGPEMLELMRQLMCELDG